jgi:hypothetical protein
MIDGACMLIPGVLSWGMRLLELAPGVIVETRGWHLGPKWQPESVAQGSGAGVISDPRLLFPRKI